MIDVALLGCGGSMPIPNRFLTSLLISYRGRKILIDCGEGNQVSMKMLGWGFKTIDVICITHFHADHIVGLPGLLSTIGNSGRTEPIIIIGPKGLNSVMNGLKVIVPFLPYELLIMENELNTYKLNIDKSRLSLNESNPEVIITTLNLQHSSDCLGYSLYLNRKPIFDPIKASNNQVPKIYWNRLQKGETIQIENKIYEPQMVLGTERRGIKISYITDTRPFTEIIEFVKNSDLFICEGMYGDNNDLNKAINNKHMLFSEAADLASKSEVIELILTHFSPVMGDPEIYYENAKGIFNYTTIGFDRLTRTLKFNNDK
ncbi:MAG: ribonuclease [Haloplasmataceae bacterium]|nr:ribonuclease [Haloplasmataceae bacterium]